MNGPRADEINGYGDGIDMYDDNDMDENHNEIGGGSSEDGEITDGEGDDMLDDDMMDKISSSPSIDDGALFQFAYGVLQVFPEGLKSHRLSEL